MTENVVVIAPTKEFTAVAAVNEGRVILVATGATEQMARVALDGLVADVQAVHGNNGVSYDA